jgi:hypothetical protein
MDPSTMALTEAKFRVQTASLMLSGPTSDLSSLAHRQVSRRDEAMARLTEQEQMCEA